MNEREKILAIETKGVHLDNIDLKIKAETGGTVGINGRSYV